MNVLDVMMKCVEVEYSDYSPYCAYGEYEGIYDEAGHSINSVGITTNNEIVGAFDYKDLSRKDHCVSNIEFFISGKCYTMSDLIDHIKYIKDKCQASQALIKIKGNNGIIYDIKDIIIDRKCRRVVFVVNYDS